MGTKFKPFESVFEAIDPLLITSLWMFAHLLYCLLRHPLCRHLHDTSVDKSSINKELEVRKHSVLAGLGSRLTMS
jgi:hypothetical protein